MVICQQVPARDRVRINNQQRGWDTEAINEGICGAGVELVLGGRRGRHKVISLGKQPEYLGTFSTSRKCFIRVKNTMLTSLG